MFLHRFAALAFLGAALALPAGAYYDPPLPKKPSASVKVKIKRWYSGGSGLFMTSFPTPASMWIPPDAEILAGSTLDFRKMNTVLNVLSLEAQPVKNFSVEAEYGDNRFSGGNALDHDWLHAPGHSIVFNEDVTWTEPDHKDFSLSRSDLSGSTRLCAVNVYARVYSSSKRELFKRSADPEHNLDLYAGYGWYQDNIRISNGYQLLASDFVPGVTTPPVGPFSGLDSIYKMSWSGFRAGFRERSRLSRTFAAEAKFAISPFITYEGVGYWNLRPDLASPAFKHSAKGSVTEFSISAEWVPLRRLLVNAGYMGMFYKANGGVDRTFAADGTQADADLESVKTTRTGWFFSLAFKY